MKISILAITFRNNYLKVEMIIKSFAQAARTNCPIAADLSYKVVFPLWRRINRKKNLIWLSRAASFFLSLICKS